MNEIIGVIGAGVMGKGVAQRFAGYGYNVFVYDNDKDVLSVAKERIFKELKCRSMFDRSISPDEIIDRINIVESLTALDKCGYIIENVYEREDVKKEVYQQLRGCCKDQCVFLVNTSCIPITRIASYTDRPDRVIGVHFMNPVPMKNFAEVIKGRQTSEETIVSIKNLLESIGLQCEVINDSAGFVSNRLSHLFMNEAASLVYENVATPEQIDNIFKKGFGHKMGPLETADLIGIDTVVDSLEVLYAEYKDNKFRVCPLLRKMVDDGESGRKTGKGFYKYT